MQFGTTSHSGSSRNNEKRPSLTKFSNIGSEAKEPRTFSPGSSPQSLVISRERMLLWYLGILRNKSIQTKSKFIDDTVNAHTVDKRFVFEERMIVFRPSFWKAQFGLHYVNSCGRISRTLNMDCVVPFKTPVLEMCRSGDIGGLKDAFYAGSVSLNVVDPLGMGLLHVSVVANP